MSREIHLHEVFGPVCGDGTSGLAFYKEKVAPLLRQHEEITFDCTGVKTMSSSFSCSLFGNAVVDFSAAVFRQLRFAHCFRPVAVSIQFGLDEGKRRFATRQSSSPKGQTFKGPEGHL